MPTPRPRPAIAAMIAALLGLAACTTPTAASPTVALPVTEAPSPTPTSTPTPPPTPASRPSPQPAKTMTTNRPIPSTTSTTTTTTTTTTKPPAAQWSWATTSGPLLGTAGTLRHFRVTVERGVPVTVAAFTSTVDATLGDARSWVGAGTVRLRHVGPNDSYNFIVYLATPATAYQLCKAGGVDIRISGKPYTSCRVGAKVVLNSDRWLKGVPNYGASLAAYRQYMINHEVGHWLGHGHVNCPGAGRPAPVMQQQTLGLQGCVANSWPYP